MKRSNIIIGVVVIAIIGALVTYNYVFNAKHRDIATEKASVTLSAEALHTSFVKDEATATTKFLDKVIELTGTISAIEDTEVVLNDKAQISFDTTETAKPTIGEMITIKGRCVGYDELLEMVKIDQATLLNKN